MALNNLFHLSKPREQRPLNVNVTKIHEYTHRTGSTFGVVFLLCKFIIFSPKNNGYPHLTVNEAKGDQDTQTTDSSEECSELRNFMQPFPELKSGPEKRRIRGT